MSNSCKCHADPEVFSAPRVSYHATRVHHLVLTFQIACWHQQLDPCASSVVVSATTAPSCNRLRDPPSTHACTRMHTHAQCNQFMEFHTGLGEKVADRQGRFGTGSRHDAGRSSCRCWGAALLQRCVLSHLELHHAHGCCPVLVGG